MPHYYPAIKGPDDMSKEELLEALKPLSKAEWWLNTHLHLLWRIIYWNWFNVYTGEEGFWLSFKHGFRDWGNK